MITPSGVTRARVLPVNCDDEGALGVSGLAPDACPLPLEGFAVTNPPKAIKKTPVTRVSRAITRRRKNPPSLEGRLERTGCGLDFVFIARISDELMNMVLFNNPRQQIFHGPAWCAATAELARRGGCRRVKVERVVLNALANNAALPA